MNLWWVRSTFPDAAMFIIHARDLCISAVALTPLLNSWVV